LKTYKHVFFDLDNTLWDFKTNTREAFNEIFNAFGLHERIPDFNCFLRIYEKNNEHMWLEYRNGNIKKDHLRKERMRLTFKEMGIDDPELSNKVGECYINTAPQKAYLFAGVLDTLQYLHQKYKLYILTNGFTEVQLRKIKNTGIQPYFDKIFMAEVIGYQKPDKRFFEYAIKSVHAHKIECLMIGDDLEADIIGANNAGIDQVFFNLTGQSYHFKPTWEIRAIPELQNLL